MKKNIITISREFGSGGRTIAKKVAELLGFDYYDKELVKKIAQETGLAEQYVLDAGEYACSKSSFIFNFTIGAGISNGNVPLPEQLFLVQYNIIKELAEKGNCIIVGRCADYVLRERKDVLNIFCHADIDFRADRIVNLYGEREESPEKRLKEKDEKRKIYYKHYANGEWGKSQNYHLCMNTGVIGIDQCSETIADIIKNSK